MKNKDSEPILECDGVSVKYITGDFKDIGIKEFILRKILGKYREEEFFAVRGVSFAIMRGDMLGIIGSNGAGKSTLLKAVSGIMVPGEGSVTLRGRISALLELGSGFDGDLTVKENTYLRGAMLGYTRRFHRLPLHSERLPHRHRGLRHHRRGRGGLRQREGH